MARDRGPVAAWRPVRGVRLARLGVRRSDRLALAPYDLPPPMAGLKIRNRGVTISDRLSLRMA